MQYISLKEATRFCNYSQDYLKLRARQGKLRAMKIGRNWVTKKEWLEEYLMRVKGFSSQKISQENPSFGLAPAKKFQFKLAFILLGIILGMTAISLTLVEAIKHPEALDFTVNVFREYFQWIDDKILTANLGNISQELWRLIPERVIEIER